jgi:TfoX/Sxy family transcriptional regulator of competence genes
MAYNEKLADRVRETLSSLRKVEEKKMMGGLIFMVNDKMCLGVMQDDLMVRLAPEECEAALEKVGCHTLQFKGRAAKSLVLVDVEEIKGKRQLDQWVSLALAFNKVAKSSKKKAAKTGRSAPVKKKSQKK